MFDIEKANICAERMKKYFLNNFQDANVEFPICIERDSSEYVLYLFYSCLLDYGMRSKLYHNNLIKTYYTYKEIFDPKYVVENYFNNQLDLLKIIKENIHPRYPNVALKKWLELSYYLNTFYSNNKLIEKIKSLNSYKELYNFINSINGYGQKTGGLLLRLIYESNICDFDDDIDDIPIDRHDIEISYLNGVIQNNKLNKDEIKKLGSIWIEAAKKNDISACDIDKYLWTIGNSLCSKKDCVNCPLNSDCLKK